MHQYPVNVIRLTILLVVVFGCSTTFATMYKWVDDEGMTHYTQTPPPDGIEAETLKPPPAIDSSEAIKDIKEKQKLLEMEREKRRKRIKEKQREAKEEARREKNCQLARARLKSLTDRPRVLVKQPDGTMVRATEEQRQKEIAESKEVIKEFCNG